MPNSTNRRVGQALIRLAATGLVLTLKRLRLTSLLSKPPSRALFREKLPLHLIEEGGQFF